MQARWLAITVAALLGLPPLRAADPSVEPITSRIPREAVESTALTTVGYSRKLHALEIEFHDGSIYRYLEIPRAIHTAMMAAESKATYYNQNVRGKYHCLRVKKRRARP